MPGNSNRRGAVRKPGRRAPPSGPAVSDARGWREKAPRPRRRTGPIDVAHKRKVATERSASRQPQRGRSNRQGGERTHEVVAGRNAVVEALRAEVPATTVWIASRIDADDRTREILRVVTERNIPLLEVGKPELDRITDRSVHQGVAMQVPANSDVAPEDLLDEAQGLGRTPLIVANSTASPTLATSVRRCGWPVCSAPTAWWCRSDARRESRPRRGRSRPCSRPGPGCPRHQPRASAADLQGGGVLRRRSRRRGRGGHR